MVSKYKKLVDQGRCGNCGRERDRIGSICSICSGNYKKKYEARREKGICHKCNKLGANGTYCDDCTSKLLEIREQRILNKQCITCGDIVKKGVYCELHKKKLHSRLLKRREDGLCQTCPKERLPHSGKCLDCWLKMSIYRSKLECALDELREQWTKQAGICVYSGRKLAPGLNAHVDHITPLAHGGSSKIDNLQFVDADVNHAKRALNENDFLKLCSDVSAHKEL